MSRQIMLLLTIALLMILSSCSSKAAIEIVNDVSSGSDFAVFIEAANINGEIVSKGTPRSFDIEWSGKDPLQTRIAGRFMPFSTGLLEEDITMEDGGSYIWRINPQGFPETFRNK